MIYNLAYGTISPNLKETAMTEQTTEPSYLDKLRARELKDTPLKQEDDADVPNQSEDNRLQSS